MYLTTNSNILRNLSDGQLSHRQPKFYGPLIGLLLANLFSKSVLAKYAPFGSLRLSYDPSPWLAYNKPAYAHDNYYYYPNSNWHPIKQPYATPNTPLVTSETPHYHHHHYNPLQQQIVHVNNDPSSPSVVTIEDNYPNIESQTIHTNIENPNDLLDVLPAESNVRRQRVPAPTRRKSTTLKPKKSVKRGTSTRYGNNNVKRNKYSPKRRPYSTTPEYYYNSYEDYGTTNRYKSKKRTKPKRPALQSYEDEYEDSRYDYDYEESYEYEQTTKPYKRRRRPTQKQKTQYNNNRNKNRNKVNKKRQELLENNSNYSDEREDYDYDYERDDYRDPTPVRPRQEEPTTTHATTTHKTIITNGTTTPHSNVTTTPSSNNTHNGYGPSNGHENITITTYSPPYAGYPHQGQHPVYGPPGYPNPSYGPPINGHYEVPYADWYSHEVTRNAIVKKVQDIIGIEGVFHRKRK